jgi:hypothetical protein
LQLKFDAKGKDAQISEEIKMKKSMKKTKKTEKRKDWFKNKKKTPQKRLFHFFPLKNPSQTRGYT